MQSFTINDTVGTIAARQPSSYRVFMEYDIDFCCGGNRSLNTVCEEKGLNSSQLLDQIHQALGGQESDVNWEEASFLHLISHIVDAYHRPLRDELPRLTFMADKVYNAHADRYAEQLSGLVEVVKTLAKDLLEHMDKEEQVLFPSVLGGSGTSAGGAVHAMEVEHREAALALEGIRKLTNQFTLPSDACNTWRAYWESLQWLDRELRRHIHLENNVLFPRALAG
ncbi:iron-sulfur cluster repair di-iron protein [bacterium]|nr:iron-sulfur cluster repair di-iron protein [bacterium]